MYRACALAAKTQNTDIADNAALSQLMNSITIEIKNHEYGNKTILNGIDVSQAIREPEISGLASKISAKALVRQKMVDLQRRLGREGGVVLDGRDIGTVVFPQAELKFFLIAPVEIRARRRFLELSEKGLNPIFEIVLKEMEERDNADTSRSLAPLVPADDAINVDTGSLSIEQLVEVLYSYYHKRILST